MVYLVGKNVNDYKLVVQGLQEIYGIGEKKAKEISWKARVNKKCVMGELKENQMQLIIKLIKEIVEKLPEKGKKSKKK